MIAIQQKYRLIDNELSAIESFFIAIYDIIIAMTGVGYGDLENTCSI